MYLANIKIKFETNKYYLMSKIITNLERIEKKLNQNSCNKETKQELQQFKNILQKNQAKLQKFNEATSNSEFDYGKSIDELLESFANMDEETLEKEKPEINQAFKELFDTNFFRNIDKINEQYVQKMRANFETHLEGKEEEVLNVIGSTKTKGVTYMPLSPEIFSAHSYCLTESLKEGVYKVPFSIPEGRAFEEEFGLPYKNGIESMIMYHEMLHTILPMNKKEKFLNNMQREFIGHERHSIIELLSDCEMGRKICGNENFFETAMHTGKITKEDGTILRTKDLAQYGIRDNELFNTEANEQEGYGTTHFEQEEMGIIKIRAMMYPKVLMYKNRNSKNPIQDTIAEIKRDSKNIEQIYGQEFLNKITDEEFLNLTQKQVGKMQTLEEFADSIAKEELGIERQDRKISTEEIRQLIEESKITTAEVDRVYRKIKREMDKANSKKQEEPYL